MQYPTLRTPCTITIAGASQTGKTKLCLNIVNNLHCLFDRGFEQIFLFYGAYQPLFQQFAESGVALQQGVPSLETIKTQSSGHILIILDDLQEHLANNKEFNELVSKHVHHNLISVIILQQNLFLKGMRDSRINSQAILLTKSPGNRLIVENLGRQLFRKNSSFFVKAYDDATQEPYTYLLVDLSVNCPDNLRIRTNIFPNERPMIVYKNDSLRL